MAKYMHNENYKKKNSKQRSKSSINYMEKLNKSLDNNLDYSPVDSQNLKGPATQTDCADGNKATSTVSKKTESNVMYKNKGYVETKVKNNFTIRGYRKRQENNGNRKKRSNGVSASVDVPTNDNCGKLELDCNKKPLSPLNSLSNSDQYLEAGTYEGQDVVKNQSLAEEILSDDDDNYSMISDYSDFCQREQYNVDCYNYYLNFGDPYVMNNGEISVSDNNWYYDRQPNFGRVFYYGNQMNDTYEGAMRYNFPNHQELKYRTMEQPYPYCIPNEVYLNNYIANSYINGYMEPSIMPSDYYQCQIPPPQEFIPERYCKPVLYEESEDVYNANHLLQENDTLNVINLNSSLFVYNSNVQINTIHNEIYGTNAAATPGEPNEFVDNDASNTTTDPVDQPMITAAPCDNKEQPKESENCN